MSFSIIGKPDPKRVIKQSEELESFRSRNGSRRRFPQGVFAGSCG